MSIVNAVRADELQTGDTIVLYDGRLKKDLKVVVGSALRRGGWVIVHYGGYQTPGDYHIGQKRVSARQPIELVRRPWPSEQNDTEMLDLVQTHMEAALGLGDELGPIANDEDTYDKIEGVFEFSRLYLLGATDSMTKSYGGTS